MTPTLRKLFFSVLALSFVAIPHMSFAGDVKSVTVGIHQSQLIKLPKSMTRVHIADRKVAGVVKHSSREVSVIGHSLGRTDIRFMHGGRIALQVNLHVTHDLPSIRRTISSFFPNESIGVDLINESLALTGMVSNAQVASQAVDIVKEFAQSDAKDGQHIKVLNLMQLRSGQQVMLRVRVGEIQRKALDNLGLGVHGILSSGAAALGALEKDKVLRILAEPSLTAISGETAEFLAGGEFPVPVMQSNNVTTVEYKSFGVNVGFTPYVLSENRLRLDVSSEVSELSQVGAVSVENLKMPAVATRRANTTVELAPGESFMIAGLVRNDEKARNLGELPALGDVPVLGALFRSSQFKRNETELVIAVTPYLVDPVQGKDIRMPTDNSARPSTFDTLFFGSLESHVSHTGSLEGPVGYHVE